jgi:hypothetical protein
MVQAGEKTLWFTDAKSGIQLWQYGFSELTAAIRTYDAAVH